MSLDRDELAARFLVPLLTKDRGTPRKLADFAVGCTDALLAALVPVAPASGAPLAAPSPAATPAATPAAWVPSVGDVFASGNETNEDATVSYARVCVAPGLWSSAPTDGPDPEFRREPITGSVRYLRRATSSERVAAGLPVDESATKPVDREGLVAAMNKAARLWVESADKRSLAECHADAAIAFMAKAPAFDRAEFNEAQEREAAKVAVSRDAGDDFTRGWLARARVAAKGGR